ncbi:hypothetical protein ASG31_03800 [Chryseobacterium sp. Leaf404]|uniref:hypothetical protein n=1 Tax=unclassified Chryseobacterium TaxID=2593645 RepID=UPI0006F8DB32|nr:MULTISPECIES: hypothetical protein [unclassified Chryseobacterium]KQT17872.1 hypothetical protein ASG31_03800 [Chryseobacterium sp. Leaf404]
MEKLNQAIGGYFELDLNEGSEYYPDAIALNTARNALEYILKAEKYEKVFIPFFTCDVVLEPFHKLNIDFEFYTIDNNLEPVFDYGVLSENQCFLYTNYFGIKDAFCDELSKKIKNLIVDNAQAFYAKPIKNVSTFYSPRKFFGVSDGSYLYTSKKLTDSFEQDISFERMSHLLTRADTNAEYGYQKFVENDRILIGEPIKKMSVLTKKILQSVDYEIAKNTRLENFKYLHKALRDFNLLDINISSESVPMVYPLWANSGLRKKLLENRIYVAKYWPNVHNWCTADSLEFQLTEHLIHLPIDQRYGREEMDLILKIIR